MWLVSEVFVKINNLLYILQFGIAQASLFPLSNSTHFQCCWSRVYKPKTLDWWDQIWCHKFLKFGGFWRLSMWWDSTHKFLKSYRFWRLSMWQDSTSPIFEVQWILKVVNLTRFDVTIFWSSMNIEGC